MEKVRRRPNIYHSPAFGVPMWAGRPQPPLTRFARDVRAFLRGKGTGGTGRVEEAYPVGVARARETEHVTVDAIRKVGTGAIGEEEGCWQALVQFQPRKTSEVSCRTRCHSDSVFQHTECCPAIHAPTPIPRYKFPPRRERCAHIHFPSYGTHPNLTVAICRGNQNPIHVSGGGISPNCRLEPTAVANLHAEHETIVSVTIEFPRCLATIRYDILSQP